jgi:hypothetical protein
MVVGGFLRCSAGIIIVVQLVFSGGEIPYIVENARREGEHVSYIAGHHCTTYPYIQSGHALGYDVLDHYTGVSRLCGHGCAVSRVSHLRASQAGHTQAWDPMAILNSTEWKVFQSCTYITVTVTFTVTVTVTVTVDLFSTPPIGYTTSKLGQIFARTRAPELSPSGPTWLSAVASSSPLDLLTVF